MQYTMEKYKQNLKVDNFYIYSYNTQVAKIDHINKTITKLKWNVGGRSSSPTTSKHINYVAREYNYTIINGEG
ncbi:MAG: hypothetical protein Unbinned2990contig1001_47 [Prokaryotic dsDNA virus sp.]|nr:MAG: hypothetical protein Unbinned2990contig1001_47 [Prokaryotic dsDNA virus sp.]